MTALRILTGLSILSVWATTASVAAAPSRPGGAGPQARQEEQRGGRAGGEGEQATRAAGGAVPSLAALAIDGGIDLDGALDEAVWEEAPEASGFVQREPFQGEPASEQTRFWVLYTEDTLYIGIRALDRDPAGIVAKEMQRDGGGGGGGFGGGRGGRLETGDSVVVLLDTFHDGRNAFYFETNPFGARADALITDEGRDRNFEWDGVWSAAARQTPDGWSAEIAIPFHTLRFDPELDSWGLNVRRVIRRKNEEVNWAPIMRDADMFRVSQYGRLTGLAGVRPARNLRLKPFITASGAEGIETPLGAIDGDADAGLDLRWGVTDSLTFDLTLNTDFAQVEADEQRVNLTRFSLFFPEKREFFLENAGIFEFGPSGGGGGMRAPLIKVYHSRQIGIADGEQIPVLAGGKLTGRAGDWSLGLLDVQTSEHVLSVAEGEQEQEIEPSTNWSVLRIKRNVGVRSNLGAIFTNKQVAGGGYNRVVGLDADLNPHPRLSFNGYFSASDNPGDDRDNWAASAGASWGGPVWRWSGGWTEIRERYDPQLGFLLRSGVREFDPQVTFEPRPDIAWLRNLSFQARNTITTGIDGELETFDGSIRFLGFRTQSDDFFSFSFNPSYERLIEPFEIREGILIPPGEYSYNDWSVFINSSDGRPVSAFLRFNAGGFFDGEQISSGVTVNVRPSGYFGSATSWDRNDVDLPGGSFTTNTLRQRFNVSFSPNLSLNSFIQYVDTEDLLAINTRFNWIYRPGADLFIVYNQNWTDGGVLNRALIFKFTYLWAL